MAKKEMRKDFGNILDESWNEYKKNFKLIFKAYTFLYIIPSLIFLLIVIMFFTNMGDGLTPDFFKGKNLVVTYNNLPISLGNLNIDSSLYPIIGIGAVVLLVMIVLSYILYLSLFYLAFNQKKDMTVGNIVSGGLKYFLPFLGLFILIVLALIPLFILLIIPGIIFVIYWIFAPFILVGENQRITESMRKSFHLVRYRWWRTFGYFLLFFIIGILASLIISLPASALAMIFKSAVSKGVVDMSLLTWTLIASFILGIISKIIVTPLGIFFYKNFYLEMKKNPIKIRR